MTMPNISLNLQTLSISKPSNILLLLKNSYPSKEEMVHFVKIFVYTQDYLFTTLCFDFPQEKIILRCDHRSKYNPTKNLIDAKQICKESIQKIDWSFQLNGCFYKSNGFWNIIVTKYEYNNKLLSNTDRHSSTWHLKLDQCKIM